MLPLPDPTPAPGMTDDALTRTIEECCLNAWPGLQQQVLDGWLLRFASGFTRRANSVQALYPGTGDVEEKLGRCEAAYAARGQPCIFKVTPLAQPAGLDDLLAARGYRREGETSVRVLEPLPTTAPDAQCTLTDPLDATWQSAFARIERRRAGHDPALRAILANIATPHIGAVLHEVGAVVSCGRAVVERDHVGLFDIATDEAHRGRGLAGRIVAHLLAWGARHRTTRAYLQVEADNTAAQRLYDRLGFREIYRYWYRVR